MIALNKIVVFSAVGALALMSVPAAAGGLFGDGGIFRGTVGNWLDRNVENPITTPLARGAAVVGGAAVGAAGAAYLGAPPQIGSAVGACAGQNINSVFAGRGGTDCGTTQMAQQVAAQYVQQYAQQYAPMGNFCITPFGRFGPGPMAPLGSSCQIMTPNGPVGGAVIQ